MDYYVGIDVSLEASSICVVDGSGKIIKEAKLSSEPEAFIAWFKALPFSDEEGVKLQRVLTDRGTEYCGNPEHHEYELYLAVEDIDHSRTTISTGGSKSSIETGRVKDAGASAKRRCRPSLTQSRLQRKR